MRPSSLAIALALLAGCDGNGAPHGGDGANATVVLKGRKLQVGVLATEKERFEAPERCGPVPEGRGWLLAWPRPRFFKLESQFARASFDVAFLGADGAVLETRTLAQGHPEGLVPTSESAHALLLGVGELKKLGAAKGDVVDLTGAFAAGLPQDLPVMKVGEHVVRVELAITEPEKQHGLMYRPRMSAEDGMLFVYREETERAFWMKNTLIPLDIAYFKADGTLVNVNETPTWPNPRDPSTAGPNSPSDGPAQYVLEMNLGWFKRKGLTGPDGKPRPGGVKAEFPPEAR
jgi:uncharacterized membrane protein (UPF0127 family)